MSRNLHVQIVGEFKNNVPALPISHSLQCTISEKRITESGEKSVLKGKPENQYWMLMIFRPSGDTALKTVITLSCKSLHGLRNT